MVIVDSSVLIDFLANKKNDQTDWLNLHLDSETIGITSLILSEVLQGTRNDRQFANTLEALGQFAVFETGSTALAIASARNCRTLRGLGISIRNAVDTFVATFCIEEGHHLLHRDGDFDHFAAHLGLSVVDTRTIPPI
jgi:predicted nucleic acid-binding protein